MSDNICVDVQKDPTSSSTAALEDSHSHEPNAFIRPDENATLSEAMSRFEAAINFVFGVVLPTVDVGSDLWLAIQFFAGLACKDFYNYDEVRDNRFLYGGVSLICPSLSFLFVTYHWWKMEKPKDRLKTLPFLLAQVWPQYRMVKLIHKGYNKKHPKHKEACSLRAFKAKKERYRHCYFSPVPVA